MVSTEILYNELENLPCFPYYIDRYSITRSYSSIRGNRFRIVEHSRTGRVNRVINLTKNDITVFGAVDDYSPNDVIQELAALVMPYLVYF